MCPGEIELAFFTSCKLFNPKYTTIEQTKEKKLEDFCKEYTNEVITKIVINTDNTLHIETGSGMLIDSEWLLRGDLWMLLFYNSDKDEFTVLKSKVKLSW